MAKNEGANVDDKNGERGGAPSDSQKGAADKAGGKPASPNPGEKKGRDDDVSRVLRTVYDDTLREDVPDEFQDLLRKLG